MITPLLLVFSALCGLLLLQGIIGHRGAIYEYPFLSGATFAGFVLPQLIGLGHDRFLPPGALESTLIMAILCAAMCWLGAAMADRPVSASARGFDEKRLLIASGLLSLCGAYFYHKISQLPDEMFINLQGGWTGLPVAYLFFARMLTYGFALAVLLVARNGSRIALLFALFGASFYFESIVIGGRRQDLVEFATIMLMAFWFQRNWCLPRPVMLSALVIGALFINSVAQYRAATLDDAGPRWDEVFNIDFIGNLEQLSEQGGDELTNAVCNIGAVSRTMNFDLGAYHWNAIVFSYVPAQLVGHDLKESLMLPLANSASDEHLCLTPPGSTPTGFSDSFQSFWYFGCLKFFIVAFIMQRLWLASRGGSLMAQLLYMLLPVQAMQVITHDTNHFVAPWIHIAIFLLPLMLWARRPRSVPPRLAVSDSSERAPRGAIAARLRGDLGGAPNSSSLCDHRGSTHFSFRFRRQACRS